MRNAVTLSSHSVMKPADAQPIFGAAEEGDAAEVARLLAAGADADARLAHGGETPLMRASARGHAEVVRVLLDAGADACARRADGFTPLILAVFFGHEGVARLLVERGADATARTSLGTTASRWAKARGFASMADLLRGAEAVSPRADAARSHVAAAEVRAQAATPPPDEVEIFSKGRARSEAGAETSGAAAVVAGSAAGLVRARPVVGSADAGRGLAAGEQKTTARASAEGDDPLSMSGAAGVSIRRDGHVPAHPAASTFRLGHFMRSWQGSVGALLLLLAFGVAVFALLRGGAPTRDAAQPPPAPAPTAPQAAAQAPVIPTPQPSPAFPTPDAQGLVPDQTYALPDAGSQPYYVPPGPVAPVRSDAPRDLTVVSEGGATAGEDAGQPRGRTGAGEAAPARRETRNDNVNDADPRAGRAARTPEPVLQRPAPPATSTNPPPAVAAPQPTPGRPKVIQWPPQ